MVDIIINLDETPLAPMLDDSSLADLVNLVVSKWPDGATSATQESDGEILFWSVPVDDAIEARKAASLDQGLMPLLGIGQQVDCHYYEIDDQAYVANDWRSAVVIKSQFNAN